MGLERTISCRIITARKRKGWNQAQLAEAAKLPPGTVSRYEQGRSRGMHPGNLAKIADATDVSVDWLLGRIN